MADRVTKTYAKCSECLMDGKWVEAPFTKRLSNSTKTIEVGNDYMPVCRFHHFVHTVGTSKNRAKSLPSHNSFY